MPELTHPCAERLALLDQITLDDGGHGGAIDPVHGECCLVEAASWLRCAEELVRASYAVRVRHCIPFLRWLLEDLSPLPVAEESEDVGTGAPQGGV